MSWAYAIAYRLGVTPWENAADAGKDQLQRLLDQVQDDAGHPGRALDLGCGRGVHTAELARRGWRVTGVDNIGRAVAAARERLAEQGLDATVVHGDVSRLPGAVGDGYDLVLDVGCFHGLSDAEREGYGRGVHRVTVPGAQLLMLAFQPSGRGPLPRGADAAAISAALPGWTITAQEAAVTDGMPRPLRKSAPQFYRLRRAS